MDVVIALAAVLVVNTYTTADVFAGVIVKDVTPDAEVTVEPTAATILAFPVAVNVTGVLAAPSVAVNVIASEAVTVSLTTLSNGTLTVSGSVAEPVPATIVVGATESVFALAGIAASVPNVMAAARARAIFLNEFIFLLVFDSLN
jgi:hypothetical protein